MKLILVITMVLLPLGASANYAEFFGSHPSTSSIGNQANSNEHDPANNYYIPALMAFSKTITFSTSAGSVSTNFEPIGTVVTKNSSNSNTDTSSTVNTEYEKFYGAAIHATLPIAFQGAGTLNVSIFTPVGKMIQTNSGDPALPEYVMYRSRYRRTLIYLNYAHKWNENFAFSLGTHIGFQAGANTTTNISLNGTTFGSNGGLKTEVKPSLAAILSAIYKQKIWGTYFTYQQEMKSNLEAEADGEINDPASALFKITIESMIYYDPHILRFGGYITTGNFSFLTALEYQIWEKYKTPVIRIKDRGGIVLPSNDYEKVKLRNIFVPKLGVMFGITDSFSVLAGLSYKATPLEGNFSGAGNSIDSNSLILTAGGQMAIKFFSKDMNLSMGAQYHRLEEVNVVKTTNQENGTTGNKIGAPGYKIGGSVLAASAGLNIKF